MQYTTYVQPIVPIRNVNGSRSLAEFLFRPNLINYEEYYNSLTTLELQAVSKRHLDWLSKNIVHWLSSNSPKFGAISINVESGVIHAVKKELTILHKQLLVIGVNLIIEIAERNRNINHPEVIINLKYLNDIGVYVFLDDFTSCELNVFNVDQLYIHGVKIKFSNVGGFYDKHDYISYLASKGKIIVVENIETSVELKWCKGHFAHYVQGFYTGKPVQARLAC